MKMSVAFGRPRTQFLSYSYTPHGLFPSDWLPVLTAVRRNLRPLSLYPTHGNPVITLRAIRSRRKTLAELISTSNDLTSHRYYRLVALCLLQAVCTLPLAAFFVYANLTQVPVVPWKGLADLHRDYGKIGHFSLDEWIQDSRIVIEFENWITIACALVFFIFFGLTEEARKHYRFAFHRVRRWLKVPASRSAR